MTLCAHGMAGYCPDCRPERFVIGETMVAPSARVQRKRQGLWWVVQRVRSDGAYDWFTYHLTRRGAQRAADRYVKTGQVKGWKP